MSEKKTKMTWINKSEKEVDEAVNLAAVCFPLLINTGENNYVLSYIGDEGFKSTEAFGVDEIRWLIHVLNSIGGWKIMLAKHELTVEHCELILFENGTGDEVYEEDSVVKTIKDDKFEPALAELLVWFMSDGKAYFTRRVKEKLTSIMEDPTLYVYSALGISPKDVAPSVVASELLQQRQKMQMPLG